MITRARQVKQKIQRGRENEDSGKWDFQPASNQVKSALLQSEKNSLFSKIILERMKKIQEHFESSNTISSFKKTSFYIFWYNLKKFEQSHSKDQI